jgi:RimJ/RimL family protein N-acetyltransferase
VALEGLEGLVLVGAGNPHREELESAALESPVPIRLESDVAEMPPRMAWADVAVTSAGSTVWELAFMAVPSLALALADNQRPVARRLGEVGLAVDLGWSSELSSADIAQAIGRLLTAPETRSEMSRRARELVDGEGARRVWLAMQSGGVSLRRAREDDCRLLWEWANDPAVRAAGFSPDAIPWDGHVEWFRRKLHEPSCLLLIGIDDAGNPVGQVRFEARDDQAEISVTVERSRRGAGYGNRLIDLAVRELFGATPVRAVHAFIKPHNEGSIRAFERARFTRVGTRTVKGHAAIHYVLERNGRSIAATGSSAPAR